MRGIVIEKVSNLYKVASLESLENNDNLYEAVARGKFKKDDTNIVVGDIVEFTVLDDSSNDKSKNKKAVIESIEDRKVYIKRPKIANITQIVFVVSSKSPKPDLLMLDKQLAFAEFLGINALIVLNKIDLDDKKEFENIKTLYENIGYKVIETGAKERIGVDELRECLENNINAFSGNSGVGKSTLINAIFSSDVTKEGEVSKKNKRGKNTTTTVKLYEINNNTYIADTPGFSTFSIEEISSSELANYFIEFRKEIENCEFVGCTHIKEENCGIKEGIEKGKISKERYERFLKIYNELKEREDRKKW